MSDDKSAPSITRMIESLQLSASDDFWSIRAKAIHEYANLEQALFQMFSRLSGMDMNTAGLIFFRIVSTRARNAIIEDLYRKKFGDELNLFRNSLIKSLGSIDNDRNKVVHWHAVTLIETRDDGATSQDIRLEKPQYWEFNETSASFTRSDMVGFTAICKFFSYICGMFAMLMLPVPTSAHNMHEDDARTWRDIFRRSIVYPPPVDHPIFQTLRAP